MWSKCNMQISLDLNINFYQEGCISKNRQQAQSQDFSANLSCLLVFKMAMLGKYHEKEIETQGIDDYNIVISLPSVLESFIWNQSSHRTKSLMYMKHHLWTEMTTPSCLPLEPKSPDTCIWHTQKYIYIQNNYAYISQIDSNSFRLYDLNCFFVFQPQVFWFKENKGR